MRGTYTPENVVVFGFWLLLWVAVASITEPVWGSLLALIVAVYPVVWTEGREWLRAHNEDDSDV